MSRATDNTYPQAWEREMRAIKKVNDSAFKHLIALPPRQALILVHLLMADLKSPWNTTITFEN